MLNVQLEGAEASRDANRGTKFEATSATTFGKAQKSESIQRQPSKRVINYNPISVKHLWNSA